MTDLFPATAELRVEFPDRRVAALPRILTASAVILLLAPHGLIGQEAPAPAGAPLAGRVLGAEVRTVDVEELRYEVVRRLTDRYADGRGIVVTESERQAYVAQVREALARDRTGRVARRDEIDRRLAAGGLTEAEREELTAERASVETVLAVLSDPANDSEEERAARAEIATAFIRQWKIHRELWRQYGGRIVFQQGGAEPLDAVRKFLEERQGAGDFTIVDRALEASFWRYWRDDSIHSFYERGSRDEAEAFTIPPWERK